MLLAQVEGFLAVARAGNLSRAAQGLFVSQPALTARLHALEEELGGPLFERGGRGMVLTEAGRAFLPYAERAVEALEHGATLLEQMARGSQGELAIGAAPAISAYVLPALLTRFVELHPNVRLLVRTGHSEEIVALLLAGDIQLGLIRELRQPGLEVRPLYEDELVLVVDPAHPFAELGTVDPTRMIETRLVMFDRTSTYFELTQSFFHALGAAPGSVVELDNIEAAKQMVLRGLGVALLPATAVASDLADGRLRRVVLRGTWPLRRQLVEVRRPRSGAPPPPVAAFEQLLERIPQLVPGARPLPT